ncbi:MAG: Maf family nucleotide pyrophosphatase [Bacteroidales bacterium]|nr:Maf family nucleotide pyrophosphatase [Bacteroidales bacterium]
MLVEKLKDYKVILASQSPRRKKLLDDLGLKFETQPVDIDETYPPNLKAHEIAIYLSQLKARAFDFDELCGNCLIITADTIVWQDGQILPKPKNYEEATRILNLLSGNTHDVITGVTLRTRLRTFSFYSSTKVYFKELSSEEIAYYIDNFKPFDKAGAYGIQEWIGYIGIEKIEGSYFNVVGLPVQKLYTELSKFLSEK